MSRTYEGRAHDEVLEDDPADGGAPGPHCGRRPGRLWQRGARRSTPDVAPPPVPQSLSAATGTLFTHFPRSTTLVWSGVSDPSVPVTYRVHVQFCQGSANNPTNCVDRPTYCPGVVTSTTCTFDFVGGQPGRWRVRAVDAVGNESAFGAWSTFEFDS